MKVFVTLKKAIIAMKKSRLSTSDFAGLSRTFGVSFAAAALSAVLLAGCGGGDSSATANPSGVATNAGNATTQPVTAAVPPDQPYVDPNVYGTGPNDALAADPGESAAVTHHTVTIGGKSIAYTATAGHLTTIDPVTSRSNATMFYVAYTQDNPDPSKPRPVTFFYNGGPGSSSVFLLLG